MKRKYYMLMAAALILIIGVGSVLTGCREKKAPDYYPLGLGSSWEYNVLTFMENGMTKMNKEIVKVIGTERVGDLESYIVDRYTIEGGIPSVGQYREYLAKTEKGVECTKRAFPLILQLTEIYPGIQWDIVHSPTEERFRNNLKENEEWKWEGIVTLVPIEQEERGGDRNRLPQKPPRIEPVKGTLTYKYQGHENISVMNREYDCIKISVFGKSESGQEIESVVWYAPNIGKVREEQKFFEGSKSVLYLFELIDYNLTNREPFKKK